MVTGVYLCGFYSRFGRGLSILDVNCVVCLFRMLLYTQRIWFFNSDTYSKIKHRFAWFSFKKSCYRDFERFFLLAEVKTVLKEQLKSQ